MSLFNKIATALRGGATEVGEAIVDHQALRILDQEIRDADAQLLKSRDELASMMAKRKLADEKIADLQKQTGDYEGYAMQALEKGDEALATEVAQRIADIETQLTAEQETAQNYAAAETQLKAAVTKVQSNLKRLKQQVDTVKATEAVQKAQMAVASRSGGADTAMGNAMNSLERLKERQAARSAKMAASEALAGEGDSSLDAKLKQAGIMEGGHSANAVLARLKAKKSA